MRQLKLTEHSTHLTEDAPIPHKDQIEHLAQLGKAAYDYTFKGVSPQAGDVDLDGLLNAIAAMMLESQR